MPFSLDINQILLITISVLLLLIVILLIVNNSKINKQEKIIKYYLHYS
ncbi:MAG: hypothetical protein GX935_01515 [Erysipelotrichia bacterium]|nr:hypothetical protein [Erysipelotrichia bacterium]